MSTPARQAEADRVELVYYWALGQLANQTIIEARELWEEVPTSGIPENSDTWLKAIVALIMRRRSIAIDLAIAYFRLVAALRTGATIADPSKPNEVGTVSLNDLRDEFEASVDVIDNELVDGLDEASLPISAEPGEDDGVAGEDDDEPDLEPGDDEDAILLEAIEELDREIARIEAEAEAEAENILRELGQVLLDRKLEEINKEQAAKDAEAEQVEAHAEAGRRQAAAAARISMNAARGLSYSLGVLYDRVIGWVRYSQTGTPCGWCAMLISRGPVYKSRGSASTEDASRRGQYEGGSDPIEDVDKYHDNCRCVAVPVFSKEQYESSDLFDMNRRYADEWPTVTSGYGGKDALRVWRAHFRQKQGGATAAAA